ncbi:hypothetical protein CERZMDRAFT_102303 [Cercospora zeae-maydis SCOH1-5]|uniref:AA1-like domain-containing protein n=1 Tax=Cercospora zeae-maydis SCOH1-5 TaxID=717836 RepID=A0A6A6F1H9_9PEZI|nr:hypothetical protein CERZMDRAFT_102303 [Cercospora zeae-maydis SCOH1-5]
MHATSIIALALAAVGAQAAQRTFVYPGTVTCSALGNEVITIDQIKAATRGPPGNPTNATPSTITTKYCKGSTLPLYNAIIENAVIEYIYDPSTDTYSYCGATGGRTGGFAAPCDDSGLTTTSESY